MNCKPFTFLGKETEMLELSVNKYGYLEIGSEEWLDDFSEVSESWTNAFRAYCEMRGGYVTSDMVSDWAHSLGNVSGIYGDHGPVFVATCNYDSFLSDDIAYSFLHLSAFRTGENGEEEEWQHTLIVVHGQGYHLTYPNWCDVREFNGDDDANAFSYASGFAAHSTREDCAEWIIENAVRLWPNGGRGNTHDIGDCILPNEDGEGHSLVCPECGDILTPYVS
jgi:hypothetical protein